MERLSNCELSLSNSTCKLSDKVRAVLVHARLAAALAFKSTARVVDVDAEEVWDSTAWVDVSKELRERQVRTSVRCHCHSLACIQVLNIPPSVSNATAVSSNYSSAAELQSTSVSHAANNSVDSNATSSSSSGQASSSSGFFSSACEKQVPRYLAVHGTISPADGL